MNSEKIDMSENMRKGIYILPNLFTTGSLFAGFYSMVATMNGDFRTAAIWVLVSSIFDGLDGKVARLTGTSSKFGVEYDSLADLVSFGVAPGLLMYSWALKPFGRLGWLAAFLFVVCGALRLARFNVHSGVSDRRYFVGLPTPAAAGIVASVVLFLGNGVISQWESAAVAAGTYIVAVLMVSTFRYYSFKELDFARRRPTGVLLLFVLAVLIVATHPQWFLLLLFSAYVLSGPTRPVWARRRDGALVAEKGSRDAH